MEMNKLTDAKEYLEKTLEIKQKSNDLATDIKCGYYLGCDWSMFNGNEKTF